MTLQEFLSDPERVKQYKRWINQDIGIIVMALLKDHFCRPKVPSDLMAINEYTSSFALGVSSGAFGVVEALENLDAENVQQPEPEETYKTPPDEKGDES